MPSRKMQCAHQHDISCWLIQIIVFVLIILLII